ncbi:unnamed protein product, partial [Staurois parvus]
MSCQSTPACSYRSNDVKQCHPPMPISAQQCHPSVP